MTDAMTRAIKDVEFLYDDDRWPRWPVCPVKRLHEGPGFPETGLVRAGETNVYILNLFGGPYTDQQFADAETYHYDTLEDLVADGWIVD